MEQVLNEHNIPSYNTRVGSMVGIFYTDQTVHSFDEANTTDQKLFAKIFHGMLERGVYLPPSPFEALFLSNSLTDEDLDYTINAFSEVIASLK